MSKKNRKTGPVIPTELPKVGAALEVPNYVIPTTDLEYKEINDQVDPRTDDCRHAENCGEDCRN